jgi:hypothetical protein
MSSKIEVGSRVVERQEPVVFEIVGRQCFPSAEMAAVAAYKKAPWVDDSIQQEPSIPGFYRVEALIRLSDAVSEMNVLREQRDTTQQCLDYSIGREDALQQRLAAAEQRNGIMTGILVDSITLIPVRHTRIRNRIHTVLKPTESGEGE